MSLIILDRDGVINVESNAYIKTPDEWLPIPGSLNAIAALCAAGFRVVIATNQSGLARGLFDLATLEKIHEKLLSALQAAGGPVIDIFYCPHHPDDACTCRKPQPGLFWQIQKKYQADLSQAYFIGDSVSDIEVAKSVGCKPLLVLTGNGERTRATLAEKCDIPYFPDLAHAAEFILNAK